MLDSQIRKLLSQVPEFGRAKNVFCYVSYKDEVDTQVILKELLRQPEKQVSVPVCDTATKELVPVKLASLETLEPGAYGIPEPKPGEREQLDPQALDVVLVPGVVFDLQGYRIGYGGGYYDRFLNRPDRRFTTVGLGYQVQVYDHVPREEYDRPVDYVVTDTRVLDCRKKRETGSG